MVEFKAGLEGVIATRTSLGFIDGKKGVLEYRGYDIKDLAKNSDFEETTYLLWYGKLPNKKELTTFKRKIRKERKLDKRVIDVLKGCTTNADGMDALRSSVSFLAQCDPDLNDNSAEANIRKGIRLMAVFPTIVSTFDRIKKGKKPVQPDPKLGHGENLLYMLQGKKPTKTEARAMELDSLLTAEHGLNASTFTARITASTLSDLHSAVCSGIGTLKGPLHGGARSRVYKMLDEVKKPDNAEKYVKNLISKHQRIMGFGHRVYKNYDPRSIVLKQVSKELADESGNYLWHTMSTKIEETVIRELVEGKGKPIYTNVDFYTGSVYKYLGIPPELSTAIFAVGRISGWVAHCMEQYSENRLIRPRGDYVGDHNKKYKQVDKR